MNYESLQVNRRKKRAEKINNYVKSNKKKKLNKLRVGN